MANLSDSRLSDSERDIADVDGLFADESSPPPLSPAAAIPSSSSQGSAFGDSDSYDLLEDDETRTEPAQPLQPVPIATTAPPKPKSSPKPKAASPRAEERETEPSDEDDAEEEGCEGGEGAT